VVLADSHGIPRAPCYLGIDNLKEIFGYKTITFYGIAFQLIHLISYRVSKDFTEFTFFYPTTLSNKIEKFRLFPVRSPLLRESFLLSFPPGTKMFQFPGFALCDL
jgi:hypothetical protein